MNEFKQKPDHELSLLLIAFAAVLLIVLLFSGLIIFKSVSDSGDDALTTSPETTAAVTTANGTIGETTVKIADENYDYSKPVPQGTARDKSWFDNAVIIGNSRAEGFILYNSIAKAKSYVTTGLSVSTAFTSQVFDVGGVKMSATEAVAADKEFSKVYIMLGVNELGWPYEKVFGEKYGDIIDAIRAANPNAEIYCMLVLPIAKTKSTTDSVFNNSNVNKLNGQIKAVAEQKKVRFIDCSEVVADAEGYLSDPTSTDGIHLSPSYCKLIMEYILCHTATD